MAPKCATSRTIHTGTGEILVRFVGGRNRRNRLRAIAADQRRREVVRLLAGVDPRKRGWQTRIAEQLGVHRGTISRDIAAIFKQSRRQRAAEIDRNFEQRRTFLNRLLACENASCFPERWER